MSTFSEMIAARYAASESETDEYGRVITVQRLRPAAQQAIRRLTDTDLRGVLQGNFVASTVRSIVDQDGRPVAFPVPQSADEINVVLNALDEEGIRAATVAYGRLILKTSPQTPQPDGSNEDTIKN